MEWAEVWVRRRAAEEGWRNSEKGKSVRAGIARKLRIARSGGWPWENHTKAERNRYDRVERTKQPDIDRMRKAWRHHVIALSPGTRLTWDDMGAWAEANCPKSLYVPWRYDLWHGPEDADDP